MIVSAATKYPKRLNSEKVVIGQELTSDVIQQAIEVVEEEKIVRYYKSSREYRREVLGVYVKRALNNCVEAMS